MDEISPVVALVLGLTSTLHCWGMCGGIVGALSMGLPDAARDSAWRRALLVTGYNLGRIGSYTLAGVLSGAAGGTMLASGHGGWAYLGLQVLGGSVIILIGIHLAGWLPRLRLVEGAGWRFWQWLQPLARRFLPIDSIPRSLVAGAIWGWLPCGLVYSMLIWAAAQADPIRGGLSMFAFGLGTLPGMISAGVAGGKLRSVSGNHPARRIIGMLLILFGLSYTAAHFALHGRTDTHGSGHVHGPRSG